MTSRADTVIVGAGIVGCVAARHLAAAGADVVLLDQGPLEDPGGSTSHAPGLVFQTNSSQLLCRFAQETTALYRSQHTPELPVWHEVGSIEVARGRTRAEWIVQRAGHARSWGLSSRLVTPEEVHDLIPLVDPSVIVGGYHVESDGLVRALTATRLLREQPGGSRSAPGMDA
jgi:glycine/D-amino acid oxidase-like deaminating enzyme